MSTVKVEDPSTGEMLAEVADACPEEGVEALDAAAAAQDSWAATAPRERGEILRRAFECWSTRAEDFALLMTLEMGKPLAEARGEVTYGAEFLRWFSEEAVRISGRYSVAPSRRHPAADHEAAGRPLPADHPVELPAGHGHPQDRPGPGRRLHHGAQARGPDAADHAALAAVLMEAGLPAGVLNVITTSTVRARSSAPIIADPRLRKLSFTGSTEVGQRLIEQSARTVLRISHGTRRQRPVRGLRRRRPGRRRRRRHAGQDAQHGRGLHRGQPVHRARVRRRRSSRRRFAARMGDMTTARGTEPESRSAR